MSLVHSGIVCDATVVVTLSSERMNDRTSAVALARRYWVRVDSHVRLVVVSGLSNEDLILLNRVDQSMLICDAP